MVRAFRSYFTHKLDGVFDHKGYTEKSLSRMIKTRARVERAATRQVTATNNITAAQRSMLLPSVLTPASQEHSTDVGPSDLQTQDGEENAPHPSTKEPTPDRTELFRSKPAVVERFMQFMVPILIDVYAASVITPVRVKTLTGLLKAVSFLDGDGLKTVLTVRRVSVESITLWLIFPAVCPYSRLRLVHSIL
jgi:E3 ubiquitin-protein ligase TRIP12